MWVEASPENAERVMEALRASARRSVTLATGLATYPDVTVVCGELEVDPEDDHSVTNPAVPS